MVEVVTTCQTSTSTLTKEKTTTPFVHPLATACLSLTYASAVTLHDVYITTRRMSGGGTPHPVYAEYAAPPSATGRFSQKQHIHRWRVNTCIFGCMQKTEPIYALPQVLAHAVSSRLIKLDEAEGGHVYNTCPTHSVRSPPSSSLRKTQTLCSLLATEPHLGVLFTSQSMVVHQWEAWPKNAVTPGNWRAVDPGRPWVPSPESQVFPLPPAHDDPKIPRIIPKIRPQWPLAASKKPTHGRDHDPLNRKPSRLSVHYWLDRLGAESIPTRWGVFLWYLRQLTG